MVFVCVNVNGASITTLEGVFVDLIDLVQSWMSCSNLLQNAMHFLPVDKGFADCAFARSVLVFLYSYSSLPIARSTPPLCRP